MKVSKNFHIKEFVPDYIYSKWGGRSIWFMDPRLFPIVQALRDQYGPITINGGGYNLSGFRPLTTKIGAALSQHRFGRAVDLKFKNHTAQEVYKDIMANQSKWVKMGLTTMENAAKTPTWLHIDIRETGTQDILIVNP